ncbi:MAG: cysteine synthase family protein, partial [Anaerohalosphaera sp.]|nr:cysteine synthase family protein [Anaerohalosphaera sp.]
MEWKETPLIKIGRIYAKLECTNPCGSIKDRIAKYIIEQSEKKGSLKPGMTIVEATSGNTGISLSCYAKKKGYKSVFIMPQNMTDERKKLIKDLGAELILCSDGDFAEAAAIRDEMAKKPGFFNTDQFSNPLNVQCHKLTTGKEIIRQIQQFSKKIDAFVAGVGTGGTLIGVGIALKELFPNVRIVAVEPTESAVMSGGTKGSHGIQGIGDGFIPAIASDGKGGLNPLIDEVICVSTD